MNLGETSASKAQKEGLELSNTALAALMSGMSVVDCCVLKSTLHNSAQAWQHVVKFVAE